MPFVSMVPRHCRREGQDRASHASRLMQESNRGPHIRAIVVPRPTKKNGIAAGYTGSEAAQTIDERPWTPAFAGVLETIIRSAYANDSRRRPFRFCLRGTNLQHRVGTFR